MDTNYLQAFWHPEHQIPVKLVERDLGQVAEDFKLSMTIHALNIE